jgi:hypothetical protein
VASGPDIQQGDILQECSVFSPPEILSPDGQAEVIRTRRDVIVMTQSCDMQRDKPPEVLLCGLYQRSSIPPNHKLAKIDNLEHARKGSMPAFHLLAESDLNELKRELTVVDFRRVYSLPFAFVQQEAARRLHLRLLPPYREHLSQAFARFFMRVGLPSDIQRFASGRRFAKAVAIESRRRGS